MPNERLRAALLEHGLTPAALGDEIGVDHKTVERWISLGRTPYRKHRYAVAARLAVDEAYLWPEALSREQVVAASDSEVLAIYPHRSDVPQHVWQQLFSAAERDIGVLVYSGLFLAEDAALQKILGEKARARVRMRILLGDPTSVQRSAELAPVSDIEREQLQLAPNEKISGIAQWVTDLAAQRQAFREKMEERQTLKVPSEDPDFEDLGPAFPAWNPPERDAILQPPKPELTPSAKILELAREQETGWEAAD